MVFGRAGEEIAQLRNAGIHYHVIPGITAASAMASELGVSLTHRDHAQIEWTINQSQDSSCLVMDQKIRGGVRHSI
jgi:siroheme synthase